MKRGHSDGRESWTGRQRLNVGLLVALVAIYIGASAVTPHGSSDNSYHFSVVLIVALTLTIIGLLFFCWISGFYAWLQLDRYARRQPDKATAQAFEQIARGVWCLAAGLIVSSTMTAIQPLYQAHATLAAVMLQVNYYVIILFPFFGFWWLRTGSRNLAVSAQAAMTTMAKVTTVGPPLALLAAFYIFLAFTNSSSDATTLTTGPAGFLVVPLNIVLVVGSWGLGMLAALNIERATYSGEGARNARPLVKLYNGILTTTGGFIILDALLSLGTTRLLALPVGVIVFLIYAFIGVVALGFWLVGRAGRALAATTAVGEKG